MGNFAVPIQYQYLVLHSCNFTNFLTNLSVSGLLLGPANTDLFVKHQQLDLLHPVNVITSENYVFHRLHVRRRRMPALARRY